MEKFIQAVVGAVIIALLSWVGYSLTSYGEKITRLDEKLNHIEKQLDSVDEHKIKAVVLEQRLNQVEYRIEKLEALDANN